MGSVPRRQRPTSAGSCNSRAGAGTRPSSATRAGAGTRPSSAGSSCGTSVSNIAKGNLGQSPWQPFIEGGPHSSYSDIGHAQLQPKLGELGDTRVVPPAPALPDAHKVSTADVRALIDATLQKTVEPSQRRLTVCRQMKLRGFCRLPSCPYVHEVCRPYKEHVPLYNVNAPKECEKVPCRFLKVLGCCPFAEACVYSHESSVAGQYSVGLGSEASKESAQQSRTTVDSFADFMRDDAAVAKPVTPRPKPPRPRPDCRRRTRSAFARRPPRPDCASRPKKDPGEKVAALPHFEAASDISSNP